LSAKKILVTGANGLLGQALIRLFRRHYHTIGSDLASLYFDASNEPQEYIALDVTDRNRVQKVLGEIRPDVVINAAAFTNVDGCETDRESCWNLNVKSVEIIEEACSPFNALLVHISTDYVFNGKSGSYRETDEPDALGYYGLTKLSAEKVIRHSHLEYIIARTMVLYGTGVQLRPNFVTWVIDKLRSGEQIKVVDDQIGNPTLSDDLAEAIYRLIEEEAFGLFHVCGNEVCSRYDFAMKIARVFDLDSNLITKISSKDFKQKAPRPMNSSFVMDKLYNTLDWLPGKLEESLIKMKSQMEI
jgi:dTDP-4-dehydrorhamnose reductase